MHTYGLGDRVRINDMVMMRNSSFDPQDREGIIVDVIEQGILVRHSKSNQTYGWDTWELELVRAFV